MKFDAVNCTIIKVDQGNAFEFAPAPGSIGFAQPCYLAYLISHRDSFNLANRPMTSKSSPIWLDYLPADPIYQARRGKMLQTDDEEFFATVDYRFIR